MAKSETTEKRGRGRPRHDGYPAGQPPPPPPGDAEFTQMALEDMRPRIKRAIRDDMVERPRQGMQRLYQETRRIARMAGPAAMRNLVRLFEESPDDRVSMMSSIAVLDRAGVTPRPYDEDEALKELNKLPLEERKAMLALLIIRAQELTRAHPGDEPTSFGLTKSD